MIVSMTLIYVFVWLQVISRLVWINHIDPDSLYTFVVQSFAVFSCALYFSWMELIGWLDDNK